MRLREPLALALLVAAAACGGNGETASVPAPTYFRDVEPILQFVAWAQAGAPEGFPADHRDRAPDVPSIRPDVTLQMAEPYAPDASADDDYRCFVVDPGAAAGRTLTGYDVATGTPERASGERVLVDIPRWDFHWQGGYELVTPERLAPGDSVKVRCVFENALGTEPLRWGEATSDEMCLAFLYVGP